MAVCDHYRPDSNGACLTCNHDYGEHRKRVLARADDILARLDAIDGAVEPERYLIVLSELQPLVAELRRLSK